MIVKSGFDYRSGLRGGEGDEERRDTWNKQRGLSNSWPEIGNKLV